MEPPGYADISVALVDAVYSIRARYAAVERVVSAYAAASESSAAGLEACGTSGWNDTGLTKLTESAAGLSGPVLADVLFGGNRSRTGGRLKADVCVEAAVRLLSAGIVHADDLRQRTASPDVRRAWTGTPGLGWVTWQYFCSLNGIDAFKPDVMLMRFTSRTLRRHVSAVETDQLLARVLRRLQSDQPALSARALDHTLWRFESGRD